MEVQIQLRIKCRLPLGDAEMTCVVRERKCSWPGWRMIAFWLMAGNSDGCPTYTYNTANIWTLTLLVKFR